MEKLYLICYDIKDLKRLAKVRRIAYSYALGGQKSALEALLDRVSLKELESRLAEVIDHDEDYVNIIEIEENPMLFGIAKPLPINEKGDIII